MALSNLTDYGGPDTPKRVTDDTLGTALIDLSKVVSSIEESLHIVGPDNKEPMPDTNKVEILKNAIRIITRRLDAVSSVVSNL